ncbi:hypothetical protein [uncultured Clostridium sp.]|uniref:hypothetical protein n=1 Tax=uncultured Clostridium sp. TaxID=59620 RepID=UPI00258CA7D5|nr:hypothetical protein [uncultured Clostridium sp.]
MSKKAKKKKKNDKVKKESIIKKAKGGKLIIERSCKTCKWRNGEFCGEDIITNQDNRCTDFDFSFGYYMAIIKAFPPNIRLAFLNENIEVDFDDVLDVLEYK